MARRRRGRNLEWEPRVRFFKPCGVPWQELRGVAVASEDLEAMRLVDGLGLTQEEAAQRLGVSKATVCRMVGAARAQVVRALTAGMAIRIADFEDSPAEEAAAPLRPGEGYGCRSGRQRCVDPEDELGASARAAGPVRDEARDAAGESVRAVREAGKAGASAGGTAPAAEGLEGPCPRPGRPRRRRRAGLGD